ncbi:MAG: hypothetical protein NWF04_01910 [Candidatus Bathyarchaeota archaeon]|nr:hypothetical protein [Candidatus Bathyarchaeota archaeon]
MKTWKELKEVIRGWLPKEPNPQNSKVKAAGEPSKATRILWYVVVVAVLAVMVTAVIVFYVPFLAESFVNRTLAFVVYVPVVVAIYIIFGRDYYRKHPREHRARIIITSGLLTALTATVTLSLILGSLPPYFWLYLILLFAIGSIIGDQITKKTGGTQL